MIPMAFAGRMGRILHAKEVPDAHGVRRTWERGGTVFVSIQPISATQTATEDGLQPDLQFRICFNLPKRETIAQDDRIEVGSKTYRLLTVADFEGAVCAVGALL